MCLPPSQHRAPDKPASYHSKIDADIDSLTSMLADLDSHTPDSSTQVGFFFFSLLVWCDHAVMLVPQPLLCVCSAVRQRALQQIPLRGAVQACAPERGVSSEPPIDGLPSSPPEPVPPPCAALLRRTDAVLLLPPAGLLPFLLLLSPEALPSACPCLLHHRLHPHRAQVQRAGQDGAAGHVLSDGEAG